MRTAAGEGARLAAVLVQVRRLGIAVGVARVRVEAAARRRTPAPCA